MEMNEFRTYPQGMPKDMERQLRATATDLLSRWLDIFATSLTTTHKSSRWRYVRFRGCVNGNGRKRMLARLTTLPRTSAACACGGKSPNSSQPYCVVVVIMIRVERKWRLMLEKLMLNMIALRYGVDYNLCWKTTRFTPYVVPLSQTRTSWQGSSSQAPCSAP